MNSFDCQYKNVIKNILENGYEHLNERMGHKNKILPGITFEIENQFPLLTLRKIPLKTFIAEMIWFITGSKNPDDFVNKFTSIWKNFTEDNGEVACAYGYRWRHHFGRDQLSQLIEHLTKQPYSRQAVIVTWDPADDSLMTPHYKKNVPCPYTFTVNITGDKLNFHNIVRSNDMILGFPHDVAGFALLQRFLAAKLGYGVGKYTHSISHAHIHDDQYQVAEEIVKRTPTHPPFDLTLEPTDFDRAEKGDETLVNEIFYKISPFYHPQPAIKTGQVVL